MQIFIRAAQFLLRLYLRGGHQPGVCFLSERLSDYVVSTVCSEAAPFLNGVFRPCLLVSMADTYLLEAVCHLNYWNARVQGGPVRSSCAPLQVGRAGINLPPNGTLPNASTLSGERNLEDMVLSQISSPPPSPTRLSSQPRVIPLAHPGQCL